MTPTFSRRHYEKIAEVFNKYGGHDVHPMPSVRWSLVHMFKADNPRFDENKFLRACTVVNFEKEQG